MQMNTLCMTKIQRSICVTVGIEDISISLSFNHINIHVYHYMFSIIFTIIYCSISFNVYKNAFINPSKFVSTLTISTF